MAQISLISNNVTCMFLHCIRQVLPLNHKRVTWISLWTVYLLITQFTICIQCKTHHTSSSSSAKSVGTALGLQCPPCEQLFCSPKNPKRLKCKGGVTTGICNCCPVCAKVEDETCGGEHDYLGKCDTGLVCLPEGTLENNDILLKQGKKTGGLSRHSSDKAVALLSRPRGVCVPDKTFHHGFVGDQPMSSTCKPKCTPEYCVRNPRAICSAIDNADTKQECQGDCQHTACRACRYTYESHPCGKCGQNDFKCIKDFGKCVRKRACSREKFPCKNPKQKDPFLKESVFECTVPECL